jgi:branched-chain amino acid transport system substrate-binding protein
VVAYMLRDMLEAAGSTETEAMAKALRDLRFETIVGPASMRGLDQQSTLGAFVGELATDGKAGTLKNWRYEDGANHMFPEADVKALRKE